MDPADIELARRAGLSLVKKTPSRVQADDLIGCAFSQLERQALGELRMKLAA